jgi:hypothetical protein
MVCARCSLSRSRTRARGPTEDVHTLPGPISCPLRRGIPSCIIRAARQAGRSPGPSHLAGYPLTLSPTIAGGHRRLARPRSRPALRMAASCAADAVRAEQDGPGRRRADRRARRAPGPAQHTAEALLWPLGSSAASTRLRVRHSASGSRLSATGASLGLRSAHPPSTREGEVRIADEWCPRRRKFL